MAKPHWFRFAFSLRMLFVVVTLLAIPLGYLGHDVKWLIQRRACISRADIQSATGGSSLMPPPRTPIRLRLFGEKAYRYVAVVIVDPERSRPAERFASIADIRLTDKERQAIQDLRELFPEARLYAYFKRPPDTKGK